jgi:hypothetical protein
MLSIHELIPFADELTAIVECPVCARENGLPDDRSWPKPAFDAAWQRPLHSNLTARFGEWPAVRHDDPKRKSASARYRAMRTLKYPRLANAA